jgi:hypothetical protein
MKILKIASLLLFVTVAALTVHAQRVRLADGKLDFLRSESAINIEFTYDNMSVGKFNKEDDYINSKKDEYNKKEPGRGDNWAKSWVSDREYRFHPKFIELFEKHSDMGVKKDAKYTMIFHTMSTEPGFNVGVWKKNAEISAEILIVETANKGNVLAKITVQNSPGRSFWGNDYDTGERLAEAYAAAGKAVGRFIKK